MRGGAVGSSSGLMTRRSLVRVQPTATIVSIMTVFRIIAKSLDFLRERLILDSLILMSYSEIGVLVLFNLCSLRISPPSKSRVWKTEYG